MEKAIELAVGRVIETMRANLGEQLTVDDMARTAMFSKFHFSRFFQRVTGVSPGRLLSAMRLQEAKHLLVSTSLTVTEISHQVGYTSVGTFSSRFRNTVGVSPTTYRQLGGFAQPTGPAQATGSVRPSRSAQAAGSAQHARSAARHGAPAPRSAAVQGEVRAALPDQLGLIFVGLFAERIPHGQPVSCTVLHRAGPYQLDNVPHGTWYLLAHSVAAGLEEAVRVLPAAGGQALCVGCAGPVKIGPDTVVEHADIRLRPNPSVEPELLRALLHIRSVALTAGAA
jgi:AraC family transcriptional regulator